MNLNQPTVSSSPFSEAIEAFNLFDKDNDRGLDLDELSTVFKAMGQQPPVQELENILETYDVNSQLLELRREKTGFLHMRKQRRRSASR